MKIDLHVHTRQRSACGRASEEEQIRAAVRRNLDGLVFTDHHALVPPDRLKILNDQFAPFKIFSGIEITIGTEDFLVIGIQDTRLEQTDWTYPQLHNFIREWNGCLILAHPFRYNRYHITVDYKSYPPDAVELHSVNTPRQAVDRIRSIARRLKIPTLSNSDAHTTDAIGQYYNQFNQPVKDESQLVKQLKSGKFKTVHPTSIRNFSIGRSTSFSQN